MKIISPEQTVFVPDHNGVPRSPSEGPFTVTDAYAAHLLKSGVLTAEQVEDVPEADDEADEEDATEEPEDLQGLKVPQLKAKAVKDGVPLHDAKTRPDIIAAFVAHRAAQ